MVIYVEYVILDNFALDLFVAILVCKLYSISVKRAFISAVIGTFCALVYSIIPSSILILYKCIVFVLSVFPLIIRCSLKQILTIAFSYLIVSSVFGGLLSLLVNSTDVYYGDGGKVFLICITSCICFLIGRRMILKFTVKEKSDYVKIEIGNKSYRGFFDNGNKVIASDGLGVIFLDKGLSKMYRNDKPFDYVLTQTINGSEIKEVIKIPCLKIYFKGEMHTYNNVNAIRTNKSFGSFDILLSQHLKEN